MLNNFVVTEDLYCLGKKKRNVVSPDLSIFSENQDIITLYD